jgi:hypothetical protein
LPREDSGKIFKQRLKAAYIWSRKMMLHIALKTNANCVLKASF